MLTKLLEPCGLPQEAPRSKTKQHETKKDELALRLKTCLLLGVQDLQPYLGKKLTKEEITNIHAENEKIGIKENTWRAGVRVNEDFGWLH